MSRALCRECGNVERNESTLYCDACCNIRAAESEARILEQLKPIGEAAVQKFREVVEKQNGEGFNVWERIHENGINVNTLVAIVGQTKPESDIDVAVQDIYELFEEFGFSPSDNTDVILLKQELRREVAEILQTGCVPDHSQEVHSALLEKADRMLQEIKETGRTNE